MLWTGVEESLRYNKMVLYDLFGLLVEDLFGSLMLAGLAVTVLIAILGAMSRMSMILISTICLLYLMMFFIAAYGGVVAVLIFFGCSIYFVASMIPWVVSMLNR